MYVRGGGGHIPKTPSMGRIWILFGTTTYNGNTVILTSGMLMFVLIYFTVQITTENICLRW